MSKPIPVDVFDRFQVQLDDLRQRVDLLVAEVAAIRRLIAPDERNRT